MGGAGGSYLKVLLLGAIAAVGFLWLLLVGTLQTGATGLPTSLKGTTGDLKHEMVMGKEKLVNNPELDLNYVMSKRKVPKGADPIHNRRAGNSRRPPGRA